MLYVSSSSSTSTQCKQSAVPGKSINKTVWFENKLNQNNVIQSNQKLNLNKKTTTERPFKNIHNTLQRIRQKKQLLTKEISVNKKPDFKKLKEVPSNPKTPITSKKGVFIPSGNDIRQENSTSYAKLPDSFYNSLLETLKKMKTNDAKCNKPVNINLMEYINVLLKMTPSDIDNLSISSCSSVRIEESICQHSKNNKQYYSEILNCISKCLNSDISDISQDAILDSPKNINLLNRLQDISKYYLEKTHEIKNICDESPQISNNEFAEQKVETEDSILE